MDKRFFPLFIAYTTLIYYLSSISYLPTVFTFSFQDLILHFGEYFVYSIIVYLAFPEESLSSIALYLAIFAFSDELHQFFVPGRFFSFLDFSADFLGAICGLIAIIFLKEKIAGERDKRFENHNS